jgi:hypothetical protein
MDIQCIFCEVRAPLPKIFSETSVIEGLVFPIGYVFSGKCRVSRPPIVISQIACPQEYFNNSASLLHRKTK